MKVAVLGAGVVGVATAWELLRDGHEVVVLDRRPEPASETSYANAGMIAPGHAYAWSSPAALKTLIRALFRDDLALRFRFQGSLDFWRWALRFALQCTAEKAARNTMRKVSLALYSQRRLAEVLAETGIACGMRSRGALYLYRRAAGLAAADEKAKILRDAGVEVRRVSPEEAAALDPVYEPVKDRFAGALYAPGDESGDARLFTRELARRCAAEGAVLRLGETVRDFRTAGDRVESAITDRGEVAADAFVLALGCYSAPIGKKLGLELPIWPVKGYSITLPVGGSNNPPQLPGVDEDNLFAFANFGDRVRLTAIAELDGWDWSHRPEDFAPMLKAAHELFPQAGDWSRAEYWAGLRPMTPNNLPIIGRGRHRNLWVNSGHGHMGWTWACGTARITADLLAGRRPEWDPSGLEPKAH
ncbi:MAG: D-amino acid dehydrogenase [Geminicoccaceae bacterium]|nr:D-amino acid dehydrogenase [Geminicoccaceae bacterium]MCS7267505.1 D-amino acid dehydrogenase [Geminicoccaceae bacterium]MDW8123709.1 D-amino acid dehydrogenase [Geminicoccaceae bacterium]MDW8342012.1 D-amino acid dehydrogenase [Geminicoccaceae bacterium]